MRTKEIIKAIVVCIFAFACVRLINPYPKALWVKTLVIMKPDAIERNLEHAIQEMIESSLPILKVEEKRLDKAPKDLLLQHYAEHKGNPFFDPLIEYMQSGPIVVSTWEGAPSIIQQLRDLVGPTDPGKAGKETIRGRYGQSSTRNTIHASDSVESAKREIRIWFSAPYGIFCTCYTV